METVKYEFKRNCPFILCFVFLIKEFSHLGSKASGDKIKSEIDGDFDEVEGEGEVQEEEEDDYEIILDSSKLLANSQLSASITDINK